MSGNTMFVDMAYRDVAVRSPSARRADLEQQKAVALSVAGDNPTSVDDRCIQARRAKAALLCRHHPLSIITGNYTTPRRDVKRPASWSATART